MGKPASVVIFPLTHIIAMEDERIDPRGFLQSLSNQAMIPPQGTKGMFVEQSLCLEKHTESVPCAAMGHVAAW